VEQSPPPSDSEVFQHMPFPFPDGRFPDSLGAVVQRTVLSGDFPAREVVHTPDGSWLLGDGVNDPNQPGASIATHIGKPPPPTLRSRTSAPFGPATSRSGSARGPHGLSRCWRVGETSSCHVCGSEDVPRRGSLPASHTTAWQADQIASLRAPSVACCK
jgi:hypothetical protein